jgi:YbbR domain-containing protein
MPYQDRDDLQFPIPRQPSTPERWLRRIFLEDWNTKLLALAITFALWFAVTGQQRPMTKRIAGVQLSFALAEGMEISNDPPAKIDVTLNGNSDKLAQINPIDLVATVTVADHTTGDHVVRLSRERVKMDLPTYVQVEGFQPATVLVRLEPRVRKSVAVEVKFEGKLPDGYQLNAAGSSPATIAIAGPASHVNNFQKAPTESISLEGRTASFDAGDVEINIPDQKVDVLNTVVKVHVDIGEQTIEKTFNVPVQSTAGSPMRPANAIVTLAGPSSAFVELRPADLKIVIDPSSGNEPRLLLPTAIQDKIKVRSIKPSTFYAAR